MEAFKENYLGQLSNEFSLALDEESCTDEKIVIRSVIQTEDEINKFMERFSLLTKTNWVMYYCRRNLSRILISKKWKCHHSTYRKAKNSKRNMDCEASINVVTIKINKASSRKDKFLQSAIPMPTKFTIQLKHSHLINVADTLRFMRVPEEIKLQFFEYFNDGLTPTAAKRFHEDLLLVGDNFVEDVSNSAKNPTIRQVIHFHDLWRAINRDPSTEQQPLQKILEKSKLYEEKGASVVPTIDGTWAVLIVTSVMKRAHKLQCSSETIFVDSTTSCESTGPSLTILLTATKAGAIPIAAVIHENQTTQSYLTAFSLLKREFPLCFGNTEAPAVFMTGDSNAEKKALEEIYPSSVQLLCHFHVTQAEWRWLLNCRNIDKKSKSVLMKMFQAVMYATNEDALLSALNNLLKATTTIPEYSARFLTFLTRRNEWTTVDRLNIQIRGHDTNNFAEASIRILKDVVLNRTKAYNTVALVDFFVNVLEKYLVFKLVDFANFRQTPLYNEFVKGVNISFESSSQIDDGIYSVPSSNADATYVVDMNLGVCNCVSGRTGAFCKHQCYLQEQLQLSNPNTPYLSDEERHNLRMLALGKNFYKKQNRDYEEVSSPLTSDCDLQEEEEYIPEIGIENIEEDSELPSDESSNDASSNFASLEDKEKLLEEFRKLLNNSHVTKSSVQKLLRSFQNIKPENVSLALTRMAYSLKSMRRHRMKKSR